MIVVNIGMPKTGTTSLHTYLQKQGFRSFHDKTKAVNTIRKKDKSKILDYFPGKTAFGDYPFNLYYKEIEQNYPDVVFIWTTRPRDSWIESWKKHDKMMRGNTNRLKEMLDLYDKHQEEIPRYFDDKRHKFMELPLYAKDKDELLSNFLGLEKLGEYPHKNRRS